MLRFYASASFSFQCFTLALPASSLLISQHYPIIILFLARSAVPDRLVQSQFQAVPEYLLFAIRARNSLHCYFLFAVTLIRHTGVLALGLSSSPVAR